MNKRLIKKICKQCGEPQEFVSEYIDGASLAEDIRRMKEYVCCVRRVEREEKK